LEKTKIALKNITNTDIIIDSIKIQSTFKEPVRITFNDTIPYLDIIPNVVELKPGERSTVKYRYDAVQKNDFGNFFDKILVEIKPSDAIVNGYLYFTGNITEDFSYLKGSEEYNAPVIDLNSEFIDLGELNLKEDKEIVVPFNNAGSSDLLIRKVESSRYCTVVKYDQKTSPGGSGNIYLIVKPQIARKSFNTDFSLISNDPEKPVLKVRLSGKINL